MKSAIDSAYRVERKANLTHQDFVRDHLNALRPVIITDSMQNWPASSKWTPEFFQTRYGSVVLHINGKQYTVRDFIDLILSSTREKPAPYLWNQTLDKYFPDLVEDIDPSSEYFWPNWLKSRFNPLGFFSAPFEILIGGTGPGASLHYDYGYIHAFICQIYGSKRFFLYSPDQTPLMYPLREHRNRSAVNPAAPDLEKYPLFRNAVATTFELQPGETLFVPGGWWHTTQILNASIGVTINTATSSNWTRFVSEYRYNRRTSGNLPVVTWFIVLYLYLFGLLKASRDPTARDQSAQ